MPRIGRPTPEEVAQYPREYAVFTQIPGALEGSVEAKVMQLLQKLKLTPEYCK